jgi:hypothetical protein
MSPALVANSLCRAQKKRTMRETKAQIGNPVTFLGNSSGPNSMREQAVAGEQASETVTEN